MPDCNALLIAKTTNCAFTSSKTSYNNTFVLASLSCLAALAILAFLGLEHHQQQHNINLLKLVLFSNRHWNSNICISTS